MLRRLKCVVGNLKTMLKNRGFSALRGLTLPDNIDMKDYSSLNCVVKDNANSRVKIIFLNHPSTQKKIGITPMRSLLEKLESEKIKHVIVIVVVGLSPKTKDEILEQSGIVVECFKEHELMFDLVSHELVPCHRRLSSKETAQIYERYGDKLPILRQDDPVSRYYNFHVNDVIEITRTNFRTTLMYKHYRVVVN
jgi:DNA-directed RNA polymerase subunit H (RpoH/RPB5)